LKQNHQKAGNVIGGSQDQAAPSSEVIGPWRSWPYYCVSNSRHVNRENHNKPISQAAATGRSTQKIKSSSLLLHALPFLI